MINIPHRAKAAFLICLACVTSSLAAQPLMSRESMGLKGPVKLHTVISSEGDKTHYYFDASGLLTRIWFEGNPYYGNAQAPVDYQRDYDEQGRVVRINATDPQSGAFPALEVTYNGDGGVRSVTEYRRGWDEYEPASFTRTFYDAQGRKTSIERGFADGTVTSQEDFEYDSNGRLISQSSLINDEGYYASVTTTHFYDASGRLIKTESEGSEGLYLTTYRYNDQGLLVQKRESSDDDPGYQNITSCRYNAQGRLIEVRRSVDGEEWLDQSYSYDRYGNVLEEFVDPGEVGHSYEYYR